MRTSKANHRWHRGCRAVNWLRRFAGLCCCEHAQPCRRLEKSRSSIGLRRLPPNNVQTASKRSPNSSLLSPEDLTITQYSLLANSERAGQLSHAVLAAKVGMERTTLTRNLRPLTRAKWVAAAAGKDRRQHVLQLTAAGRRKLVRSLPLWEEAQRQFLSQDRFPILAGTQSASCLDGISRHESIYSGSRKTVTYLDIQRSSDCIFIQLTLNEGRVVEQKQRFYKAVAGGLHRRLFSAARGCIHQLGEGH
jgi:DNA-binding MarR family transcriptional regulator